MLRRLGSCLTAASFVALLLALASQPARADVLVVDDSGGPGVAFTSLAAAVAAAADGDVVLIQAGDYAGFRVDGKGLTLAAAAGAAVNVDGTIELANLPAGGRLVLRGLATLTPAGRGLWVRDCAGSVWIEGCAFRGAAGGGGPGHVGVAIHDSAAVNLVRVEGRGGAGGVLGLGLPGGDGLEIVASTVGVQGGTFVGGNGGGSDALGGDGGSGAQVADGSQALFAGATFRGGAGGWADSDFDIFCGCEVCNPPGAGGAAMLLRDGSKLRTLDLDLEAGLPGFNLEGGCPPGPAGADLLVLPSSPPSLLQQLTGSYRSFRATSPVTAGGSVTLFFDGEPGDLATLLVSLLPGTVHLPLHAGTFMLGEPFSALPLGSMDAAGNLVLALTAPALPPGLAGLPVFAQGLFKPSAGKARLGSGSATLLLEP